MIQVLIKTVSKKPRIVLVVLFVTLSYVTILHNTPQARADASTYYVRPTDCSDDGSGSSNLPYCTIQKAANTARAGDTVLLYDGIYRSSTNTTFSYSGTESQPITFRAIGDGAILTGNVPLDESLFQKTAGFTSVYEITEAQIPASAYYQGVFDIVRSGLVQLDGQSVYTGYRSDQFNNILHENSAVPVANIAAVDSTTYSWYFDTESRKLYIHTREGDAPTTHEWEVNRPFGGRFLTLAASVKNLVFDGLIFRYASIYFGNRGNENITVQNFETIGSGMSIDGGAINVTFQNCHIHDTLVAVNAGYDGLNVSESTGAKIINCVIERGWNNIQWGNNTNTLFDRVISRDCPNHPMNGSNSINMSVSNSIILRGQEGFYIHGDVGMTIGNSLFSSLLMERSSNYECRIPNQITLRNNIFSGYYINAVDCPAFTWAEVLLDSDDNYFLPTDGPDSNWLAQTGWFEICHTTQDTLTICQGITGQDMNSRTADGTPLWTDWTSDNFHLLSGALVVDTGVNVGNSHDYDNVPRPKGAGFDIGAFEYDPNCTPNWWCTNWSVCADSQQTRSCHDDNNCGSDAGRPVESADCDSTAPGVVVDLMAN
ncbi:MAG: right-handed parallel beta-helix repeat-containing protein [Patescibacteria group bacterium]|jgi:hypothetical protein